MFKFDLKRLPVPDMQTGLLFVLTTGVLINALALIRQQHYPPIITYNPVTNFAEVVTSSRDEQALFALWRGGFRHATAMALGAYPFEMPGARETEIKERILDQYFTPPCKDFIKKIRGESALFQNFGTSRLTFHSEHKRYLKIMRREGGLFFEAFFVQTIPLPENQRRIRTFHARAMGYLAPATLDNPYGIKFSQFDLREIQPKTPR